MDKYLYSKEKIASQFVNSAEKFREKMFEYTGSDNMIFTEDLKNMAHLVQSPEDIDLVERMMKKFNSQNKELRFGNFVFGKSRLLPGYNEVPLTRSLSLSAQVLSSCACSTC